MSTAGRELVKEFRGQFLVWFGIIGGALTIVDHWSNIITLADWMRWIVAHFVRLLHAFWQQIGALLNIEISPELASTLSLIVFYTSITIGTISFSKENKPISPRTLLTLLYAFVVLIIGYSLLSAFNYMYFPTIEASIQDNRYDFTSISLGLIAAVCFIGSTTVAFRMISDGSENEKLLLFMMFFALYLITSPLSDGMLKTFGSITGFFLSYSIILLPVAFAPAKGLIKRIGFLLTGVALIFGLSELSKLAAHLQNAAQSLPPS